MSSIINNFLFVRTGVPKLENYLNLASLWHKLKAGNVANASTPGYKSRDINFESEFEKLNGTSRKITGTVTHPAHIPLGHHKYNPPKIAEAKVQEGSMNSVDIDKEISGMAQNELLFTIGARMLQRKFEGIRKAITNR